MAGHPAGLGRAARRGSSATSSRPNGAPFTGDPRWRPPPPGRASEGRSGTSCNTGPELEFFLFRRDADGSIAPLPHDQAGYFDSRTDLAHDVRQDMVDALEAFGIRVEAAHHEVADGQHEIDFEYADALRTADNAVTFKFTLKAIAQPARPVRDVHAEADPRDQRLRDAHAPEPVVDRRGAQRLRRSDATRTACPELARSYMAGILAHARGMIAVLAPLVNSYKRLVPGYEAPTYLTWGRTNRSALIRVPKVSPGRSIEAPGPRSAAPTRRRTRISRSRR